MTTKICERLLVVGLGLIGGSLAQAARAWGVASEVLGSTRSDTTLDAAIERGVIDRGSNDLAMLCRELSAGDIVLLATPVLSIKATLAVLHANLAPGVIITDTASVKGSVLRDAQAIYGELPATFVLGHPIAGSEKSGIDAADPALYRRHRVILTPLPHTDPAAVHAVTLLWQAVGAHVSSMSVETHDNILARTSHLPHLLAFTLVDTLAAHEQGRDIFRYAAGGFRDFTRIAGSDPLMWHDITLANHAAIVAAIDEFQEHLSQLRDEIAAHDGKKIQETYTRAREARHHFLSLSHKDNKHQE